MFRGDGDRPPNLLRPPGGGSRRRREDTLAGDERPRWVISLTQLRKSHGVAQERVAAAWRERLADLGKDRTFVSKMEHGKVTNPPSPTALYFILHELHYSLDDPRVAELVVACYGEDQLESVLAFWSDLDLAEGVRAAAERWGVPQFVELCTVQDELPPASDGYWRLSQRMLWELVVRGRVGGGGLSALRPTERLGRNL